MKKLQDGMTIYAPSKDTIAKVGDIISKSILVCVVFAFAFLASLNIPAYVSSRA